MSAYKEIQVPVEKVKEVYEKFYKELKELEPAAADKEQKVWESWKEFEEKENNLRKEYYKLVGGGYYWSGPNPYLSLIYCKSSPVSSFILTCERMFEALSYSTGTVTMTQEQVSKFEFVQSGKAIEQVKKYISDPIKEQESFYQVLIDELKAKKSVAPKEQLKQETPVINRGDQGSFGGAMFGIVCLFALVCVMIKSCS